MIGIRFDSSIIKDCCIRYWVGWDILLFALDYVGIRFEYVPLGDGWVGGNIRSVLHTKVHYISTNVGSGILIC